MRVYKPYNDVEYANLAIYCNDNNCHIVDRGDYLESEENEKYIPTYEDVRQMRLSYRRTHIDDKTSERSRKMANGSWTEKDEQEYLALDAEVTAWIEENLPYPIISETPKDYYDNNE